MKKMLFKFLEHKKSFSYLASYVFCSAIFFTIMCFPVHSATLATERIGFVDLERIFNAYPKTTEAKKEIDQKRDELKESIDEKQQDVLKLENEYSVEVASITYYEKMFEEEKKKPVQPIEEVSVDTGTVVMSTMTMQTKRMDKSEHFKGLIESSKKKKDEIELLINQKKKEISVYQEKREREIQDLEQTYSYNLLGDLYDLIAQIAKKHGFSAVMDKNNVLFGEDIGDITDFVLEDLKQQ